MPLHLHSFEVFFHFVRDSCHEGKFWHQKDLTSAELLKDKNIKKRLMNILIISKLTSPPRTAMIQNLRINCNTTSIQLATFAHVSALVANAKQKVSSNI